VAGLGLLANAVAWCRLLLTNCNYCLITI
jgi:hypothetical protein